MPDKFASDFPTNPLMESKMGGAFDQDAGNVRRQMVGNTLARPLSGPTSRPPPSHRSAGDLSAYKSTATVLLTNRRGERILEEDKIPSYHREKRNDWKVEASRVCNAKELRQLERWGRALKQYNRLPAKQRRSTPAPAVCCPTCSTNVPVLLVTPDEFLKGLENVPCGMPGKMSQPLDTEAERKAEVGEEAAKKMREGDGFDTDLV
jgi:hypothetical protein